MWSKPDARGGIAARASVSPSGPGFLGIGAQKAGTTWLYRNLNCHPQLCFPGGKEIHFWDQQRERGVAWWLRLFEVGPAESHRGEITPAYALLDRETVREIARHCPRTRLFYSLRNPVERAWSSALMALGRAEMRESEASDQWFIDHFRSRGSRERGDYEACLRRWWSVFPREQLHCIVFDDILARPRAVLEELARHLRVDERFFDSISNAELAEPVFSGMRVPLRESLVPVLRDLYAQKIDALSRLIDRDLEHWKSGLG